jgi:hypothetical protein
MAPHTIYGEAVLVVRLSPRAPDTQSRKDTTLGREVISQPLGPLDPPSIVKDAREVERAVLRW